MYVSNNQVSINNLVSFMQPWYSQKTYTTIDIAILATYCIFYLPYPKRNGVKMEIFVAKSTQSLVYLFSYHQI